MRRRGGTFGNSTSKNFNSNNTRQSANNGPQSTRNNGKNEELEGGNSQMGNQYLLERCRRDDALDLEFGFPRINDTPTDQVRLGWLVNVHPTLLEDKETHIVHSCVDFYFLEQDGSTFKATIQMYPYFYLGIRANRVREVEGFLQRKFESLIYSIEPIQRVDLEMKNHLAGLTATYLRVSFLTVQDLVACRLGLTPIITANKIRRESNDAYEAFDRDGEYGNEEFIEAKDHGEYIEDIREFDVPYYQRVMIDTNIRVSKWYDVRVSAGKVELSLREDMQQRAQAKVLAFDIECTKAPLKFPDTQLDSVMMISYMIDGQGYLIINREHVGADIEDFEYTPKPEMRGPFIVWNVADEVATIQKFVEHIKEERPNIFVTFNGDGFDWKFLEERSKILKIPLSKSLGLAFNKQDEYYSMRHACHLDAFHWVRRDSYLPQGSQGLKAVTRSKLGYDPLEVDPELMVEYALQKPIEMAQYSVSDAVATYYLYMKYVHPFIFSLCNILPMHPDDVLRKGTGTLCEALLMVEAHKVDVIFPNKKGNEFGKFYDGHLIESETYVGGHVEALAAGIYRSDLPTEFRIDSTVISQLKKEVEGVIKFFVEVECKASMEDLVNFDEIKQQIHSELDALVVDKKLVEEPRIYHVDVAAMYPNIILTYRLQPTSMVNDTICSSCIFNQPESKCKKKMEWQWRVDYLPSRRAEYEQVKSQLELESFAVKQPDGTDVMVSYMNLPVAEQQVKLKSRLKEYCRNVYKKTHETQTIKRKDTVCMRENPLYVDTVRDFRDRRYIYRTEAKNWGRKLEEAKKINSAEKILEASEMVVLYDSLQLAHKCILNSFYGYVMRKGARWYSMEMAAIVTHTGAEIIKRSRELIERIGKPLELDTDGIWCCLPKSFPDSYDLLIKNPNGSTRKTPFNFLCSTLNARIHAEFSNHQYQTLENQKTLEYSIRSECSIFFELDGPYKCMVLPTSTQEGKQLKKRYAVFGHDNKLHEFKGFELKRRGELKAVKDFQSQIFDTFLQGSTLVEAYNAAASVADYFLDILDTKGLSLRDEELLDLLSESRSMSKGLDEYEGQKSTSITTAKRLAEFLGTDSGSEKGLACRFILSKKPEGKSIAERAIPVQIFSANYAIQLRFIRKWCGDNSLTDVSMRAILDWDYYRTRLCSQFQKLITLPAYFQGVSNPLKRVPHPDWLAKKLRQHDDGRKQLKISEMFKVKAIETGDSILEQQQDSIYDATMRTQTEESERIQAHPDVLTDQNEDVLAPLDGQPLDIEDIGSIGHVRASNNTHGLQTQMDVDSMIENSDLLEDSDAEQEVSTTKPNILGLMMKKRGVEDLLESKKKASSKEAKRKQLAALALLNETPHPSSSSSVPSQSGSRKRARQLSQAEYEDLQIDALGEAPDEETHPIEWLKWHKKLWRLQLERRKRRRKELGVNSSLLSNSNARSSGFTNPGSQVDSFLNRGNLSLLQRNWNILQITESERPGILRLWVVTDDGLMHKVDLKVDRKFYINSYSKLESYKHHEVQSTLPRMRQKHHLYAWELEEKVYLEQHKEIEAQKTDPNIEGFYESQVPLTFRAVMELGCLCRVKSGEKGHDLSKPWELSQLEALVPAIPNNPSNDSKKDQSSSQPSMLWKPSSHTASSHTTPGSSSNTYLDHPRPKFVYLYQTGPSNRHVFGIYDPSQQKCNIIYLSVQNQDDITGALGKIKGVSENAITFEVTRESTPERIYHSVNNILAEFQRNSRGPMIVIFQCSMNVREAIASIPTLKQLPLMQIAANKKDDDFPSLGWLKRAGGLFVQRALLVSKWYNTSVELARYTQVPIGNFETDFALFLSDVFFARRLKSNDCVMWYSEKMYPDLGGNEDDDNAFAGEIVNPDKIYADCVETVSIEIDITGLAVNSILQSNHIPDLESSLLMADSAGKVESNSSVDPSFDSNQDPKDPSQASNNNPSVAVNSIIHSQSFDETTACVRAFKVLKNLVTTWSVDTMSYGAAADLLVSNFYRWISSPHSKMYDPALHKLVHKLIKKVYMQLLAEFKKLGARIIYASFNKLIIATDKRSLREAQSYASFLQKTFKKNRELFRYIEMVPKRFYDILLFKDPHNFVAIQAESDVSSSSEENKNNSQQNSISSSLNIDSQSLQQPESQQAESQGMFGSSLMDLDESSNCSRSNDIAMNTQPASQDNSNSSSLATSSQLIGSLSSRKSKTNGDIPTPISVLHLADYLPKSIRDHLSVIIYGFVIELFKSKRETIKRMKDQPGLLVAADAKKAGLSHTGGGSMLLDDSNSASLDIISEYHRDVYGNQAKASISGELTDSTQEMLTEEDQDRKIIQIMTQRLFNITKDVQHISSDLPNGDDQNQQKLKLLVHPDFKWDNPPLEFVKVACYMLSLKKSIQIDIMSLKRNLLKSLHVREFSGKADFQDPVISYTLPNVVCGYCNSCRDLDMLRDPRLLKGIWDCPSCSHTYDRAIIEERLVDVVQRRLNSFQTQDIQCLKCGDIQAENLNTICSSCSGALTTKEAGGTFKSGLSVFLNIARYHKFAWLEDTLDFLLQSR